MWEIGLKWPGRMKKVKQIDLGLTIITSNVIHPSAILASLYIHMIVTEFSECPIYREHCAFLPAMYVTMHTHKFDTKISEQ